ncbi:hypothetical protein [Paraburkholderia youngii]|uniref:hypothetical protein n=1 Tax=Paraburkholderia youngii TaxID=2782701 RepID=UPI003D1D2B05
MAFQASPRRQLDIGFALRERACAYEAVSLVRQAYTVIGRLVVSFRERRYFFACNAQLAAYSGTAMPGLVDRFDEAICQRIRAALEEPAVGTLTVVVQSDASEAR